MARSTTRAGDFTGRQKETLARKHAEEQKAAAASIAMATAAAAVEEQEPVELTPRDLNPVEEQVVEELDGGLVLTDVEVEEPKVKFRVNETLEQVTIGYGNHYDFEEGREYVAPKSIYDHLESKGLIWH